MLNSYRSKTLLGFSLSGQNPRVWMLRSHEEGQEESPGRERQVKRTLKVQIIHDERNSVTPSVTLEKGP